MRKIGVFVIALWIGFPLSGFTNPEDVDYAQVRIKKFPLSVQCYSFRNFTFFETLDKVKALGLRYVQPYVGQSLIEDQPGVTFDHNLSPENRDRIKNKMLELGLSFSGYGVVPFENEEEAMRQVFTFARDMGIPTIVTEPPYEDFELLEKIARRYRLQVAIHNHPAPSKYAHPEKVLEVVQGRDERLGGCVDTGHWMRTGIDPVAALRLLEGRLIDVHLKDLDRSGDKEARDVPYGLGEANIRHLLAELTRQNYAGFITVEYESEPEDPSASIKKGIEFIQSITYYQDYEEILSRSRGRYSKRGWNHYGPGYFILDEKTGVLKSQGGMGLFWYSVTKYKDWAIYIPATIFVLIILCCYFSFGLIATIAKNPK